MLSKSWREQRAGFLVWTYKKSQKYSEMRLLEAFCKKPLKHLMRTS